MTSSVRTASAPPAPPAPDRQQPRTARAFRADIQGLRAVAVSLVVLFHLWPTGSTGGFVGVDVFFVISGFLITSHLLRPAAAHRRVDLAAFWARRVRRLLPAALARARRDRWWRRRLAAADAQWATAAREVIALGAVRRELAARPDVGRLPGRRERPLAGAALLVAVGGGAVLPGLAGAHRAARRFAGSAPPPTGRVVPAGLGVVVPPSLACSVHAHRDRPGRAPTS